MGRTSLTPENKRVRDKLVALAKLASMDAAVQHFDQELKDIPTRIESMAGDVAVLESLLSRERAQLEEAEEVRARAAEALQDRVDGLSKARTKLAKAQNMRESEAGQREVESFRRSIRDKEAELGKIDEALTTKREAMAEREKAFAEARELFQTEESASQARMDEMNGKRSTLVHGREELLETIGKSTVKRYDRLRTKFMDAVVLLNDGSCPGCRMALPAQLFIDMQRGEKMTDCPQCRRIVIYRPLVADSLDASAAPQSDSAETPAAAESGEAPAPTPDD